ncbi:permease-like cell division protein FtsX [Fluviicola sp.]|uniref:cell division protein FtsX n=1 Tax=Fluviicola sp. TaxID=1917219 RepID=UPI0031DF201C
MSKRIEKTGKKGLRTSYVSTVIGISLVLFMIGLVLAGVIGLDSMQKQARENLHGDLFFKSEYNAADIKQVEQELKSWDCFKEVVFVSPERAIEEFKGSDQNSDEILAIFEGENPLPPTINFRPVSTYATKKGMKEIETRLHDKYADMLAEVNYDKAALEEVNLGFKQIAFLILLVASLLIVVAVAMINNTIRLALYSRRFTIKTMQLVGATSGFIRRPFLKQAVFQGIVSGIIGMAFLMTVFFALNNILDVVEIDLKLLDILLLFASLLVIGCVLTIVSTWFALNKYLRAKLDDLY